MWVWVGHASEVEQIYEGFGCLEPYDDPASFDGIVGKLLVPLPEGVFAFTFDCKH